MLGKQIINISATQLLAYQIREIRDSGQSLADHKFEGYSRKKQNEAELKSVLW